MTNEYLSGRVSLLEDNSFTFFEKHGLGQLNSPLPSGYQAIWEDRAELVVAKLASGVSAATSISQLPDLVMQPGGSRAVDAFVEIAVFARDGVDTRDVDLITVETKPSTSEEGHRWEIIKSSAGRRVPSIAVIE